MKLAVWTGLSLLAITCALPVEVAAKDVDLKADCASSTDPIMRTPTAEMGNWLADYAGAWDEDDDYTVSAPGAMGRVFNGGGRLIHPRELAASIERSDKFTGKKRKAVWLGISDTLNGQDSYAAQLSRLLKVKVDGCEDDAFYMKKGGLLCGSSPVYVNTSADNIGRSMPAGFKLGDPGLMMLFCAQGSRASIDPRSMLSAAAVYGLYPDEVEQLTRQAETDDSASFRLYQYYWISKRDPDKGLDWLEKSANQGFAIARFNIAYELFESGTPENTELAAKLAQELADKGFPGPDLRQYYLDQ